METLVAYAHHEQQFHNNNRNRFNRNHNGPFSKINCRTFQSGSGLLPIPNPVKNTANPVTKHSPKNVKKQFQSTDDQNMKRITKSNSVPITLDIHNMNDKEMFCFSELWAGPAYSNSPPPSSLPIPKFSVKPKRTVSLELPLGEVEDVELLTPVAKSAPPSPTREHKAVRRGFFMGGDCDGDDEFATKTLRRILNLDE